MNTYYVSFKRGLGDKAPLRAMRAANIDNLRKALSKKLKVGERCFVYNDKDDPNSYVGGMMNLGVPRNGWPEYLWVASGMDYSVDSNTGKIRRF